MSIRSEVVNKTVVVILAAGKGTRMGSPDVAKVCLEIDGKAAINRQIATFKALGFSAFVIVLGSSADQVMATVNAEHPNMAFVYQSPQLGTGHAAQTAARCLEGIGHDGYVLVSMGDKLIEPGAIEAVLDVFAGAGPDLALLTVPRMQATGDSSGRVFIDKSGAVVDIIERIDIARRAIADRLLRKVESSSTMTGADVSRAVEAYIRSPGKQKQAVPELLEPAAKDGRVSRARLRRILRSPAYQLEVAGKAYTAGQIESRCRRVNPSLYLFRAAAFYHGTALLDRNNAQGEYYLTDIVRHLAGARDPDGRPHRVIHAPIEHPEWIQGFNSPGELLAIRDYVRRTQSVQTGAAASVPGPRLGRRAYRSVSQWLTEIKADGPSLRRRLAKIYGAHRELHARKRRDLSEVLTCYGKRFGFDDKVCIVRAPGRVNIMGRHIDHRGGCNNFLAIDRETIAVAGVRNDDNVVAVNTRPGEFPRFEFNIAESIGQFAFSEWIDFVNSEHVRSLLRASVGHWSNYVKAAMLRLQHYHRQTRIRGLNLAVTGDVPMAAGLSSSSTLVVATLQAAIALNGFDLATGQFIDLCGEGEWFVGSRGGAGDHAAIRLGRRGRITRVGYLPFRIERVIDAPRDYQLVIANSGIAAPKSAAARDTFNARVAASNLGFEVLRGRFPHLRDRLHYVRDLDPNKLGCTAADVYRMLLSVPQFMTRRQFRQALGESAEGLMQTNFATHGDPGRYGVRGVLLFGVSEIIRSRVCCDYLESGRIEAFGRLMNVSHDGDRVSRPDAAGRYVEMPDPCTDASLRQSIDDLASGDPQRVLQAQLSMQAGAYACSTPEIDEMVDIACATPGVVGAQLAGAGLGGCIMVLAARQAVDAVRRALARRYYRPRGLTPEVMACITTEGAGLIEF